MPGRPIGGMACVETTALECDSVILATARQSNRKLWDDLLARKGE